MWWKCACKHFWNKMANFMLRFISLLAFYVFYSKYTQWNNIFTSTFLCKCITFLTNNEIKNFQVIFVRSAMKWKYFIRLSEWWRILVSTVEISAIKQNKKIKNFTLHVSFYQASLTTVCNQNYQCQNWFCDNDSDRHLIFSHNTSIFLFYFNLWCRLL